MRGKAWLLLALAVMAALLLVLAACAAEATPTPTPGVPTPTPTPRAPTPTPTPLPPGVTPTPTPTPVPKTPEQITYEKAMEEFKLVEAAARKEGLVYLYGDMVSEMMIGRIAGFNKSYPEIKVDGMDPGPGYAAHERARIETKLGKRIADIFTCSFTGGMQMSEEGHTIYYVPPATLEPGVLWLRDPWVQGYLQPVAFFNARNRFWLVNTKLLPPEQRPKTWLEMADPKWRGRLAVWDPSLPGGSVQSFHALKELLGEQYMRDLLANITIVQGAAGYRAVASGEYPIHLDVSYQDYILIKEAPVELVVPEEGVPTYYSDCVLIFKDAPHTNAAKVWTNWHATKEGQEVQAMFGGTPLRADVQPLSPLLGLSGAVKILPGTPKGVKFANEENTPWRAWVLDVLKKQGKK